MDALFLLAFAVAPGVCIAIYVYLKDKHEREPLGLLVKSFFYGMLSIPVTLLISVPISELVPINETDLTEQAVHAFLIVALVEEFSKFIFVRGILYRNQNFNEPFDGIVYSVMVGMGFATLENIMYVYTGGWEVAILRMFTAVPAHASFAVLMGYYLGLAKFVHKKSHYGWYALGIATLFHGAYDYFWFISFVPGIWVGAIASLVIGVMLSRKAIKIHQDASPFHPMAVDPNEIKPEEPTRPSASQDPESTDRYLK
jgi:RsiW-degrading membrane proteinase PrsW (M82 family)